MNLFRGFMMGRRGLDHLSVAMLIVGFCLAVISKASGIHLFYLVAYVLMLLTLLRFLSRNILRREMENQKFLSIILPFRKKVGDKAKQVNQRKTYRFFRCKQCGQTLRVPKGKGKIQITCPKCHYQFIKKT